MSAIEDARAAFERRDWRSAQETFMRAHGETDLTADDHFDLAEASWWLGEIDESLVAFEDAYRAYLDGGHRARAALAAFFLGLHASERGDSAIGSAWLGRSRRLLDEEPECSEHGFTLYVDLFTVMGRGELDEAMTIARRIGDLGERHGDDTLRALGALAKGRVLVKMGRTGDGMTLLDEAMLAALSDQLHPAWTGTIYCHLMDVCHELMDLRRAGEWTEVSSAWCQGLGDAGLIWGICRVHRSQILKQHGEWDDAEREASEAGVAMSGVHIGTVAESHYEVGEIRRLRGDLDGAEESFRRAHQLGRDPQPGLALVRSAEGRVAAASTSLRTALTERATDPLGRVPLLDALVEVAIAAGEIEAARSAASELRSTASTFGTSGLGALASRAMGALYLADGNAETALTDLRTAARAWLEFDAPYELARTRVLIAEACRVLGSMEEVDLEIEAAAKDFDRLGARLDLQRVQQLRGRGGLPDGITPRELDVLRLVATGKTNREVADELFISERTVARHLANLYTKLGISSRTAATAYAFEHGLA